MRCNCILPCQCFRLDDLRPAFTSDADRERFHRETRAADEQREIMRWHIAERARLEALDRREP